ncbi:MAG: hypothetical protein ACFFE3_12370 [Candidatus Thorarchaeota archaeon]
MEDEERDPTQKRCDEILDDSERGKLVLDLRRVFRHPLLFLKITDPFLTAHHPVCGHFDEHSLTIRGRKWCIGCTFNTISFFLAMSILLAIWIFDGNLLNRFYLFWGGVIGSILYFLTSLSGLADRSSMTKVASKFILGSSFASICWSILLINGLLSPELGAKLVLILVLYLGFVTVLNIKRSYEIFHECEDCEFKMRWSKCPGFREITCRLVEQRFVYPEEK